MASATTRAITDAAGMPHGLFHYCFDSRHALLHALLERESDQELAMAMGATLDPVPSSLEEALTMSVTVQLAGAKDQTDHFVALSELSALARTGPDLAALTRHQRTRDLDLVSAMLRRWQGHPAGFDVEAWASVILSGVDGITERG